MSARPSAENDVLAMRYFIDTEEVSEAAARRAEQRSAATVAMGGSGVVPERLRQPGETPEQYLVPWLAMESTTTEREAGR